MEEGGIMGKESWSRSHEGGLMGEESWRRNHGGGTMGQGSGRHLGGIHLRFPPPSLEKNQDVVLGTILNPI